MGFEPATLWASGLTTEQTGQSNSFLFLQELHPVAPEVYSVSSDPGASTFLPNGVLPSMAPLPSLVAPPWVVVNLTLATPLQSQPVCRNTGCAQKRRGAPSVGAVLARPSAPHE